MVKATAHRALLCLLASAGCYVAPAPETEPRTNEPPEDAAPSSPEPEPDAASDAGSGMQFDSGAGEPGERMEPTAPPHHPSCRFPSSLHPAPLSWPRFDEDMQPQLDAWRELSCADAGPVYACDDETFCPFIGNCIRLVPDQPGYCVPLDDCTAGVPLSYRDGACSLCVPALTKQALCCAGVAGIDCRPWPFASKSKPGEPCFEHADCESGLECVNADETSYPFCACPGVLAEVVERPEECHESASPGNWGKQPSAPFADCVPAAPGWVDERVVGSFGFALGAFTAAGAPDGSVHLIYGINNAAQHATMQDGVLSAATPLDVDANVTPVMAIDAAGHLHVAYFRAEDTLPQDLLEGSTIYATDASGVWTSEKIADRVYPSELVIDAQGEPVIAGTIVEFNDLYESVVTGALLRRQEGAWTQQTFPLEPNDSARLRIGSTASTPVLYWAPFYRISLEPEGPVTTQFLEPATEADTPSALVLASDANGVVHLVFDGSSNYSDYERGYGRVQLLLDPGSSGSPELLFAHDDPRYFGEETRPSIAFGSTGSRYIAYRTPAGLTLRRDELNGSGASLEADVEVLMAYAPYRFELAIDGEDEPQLFYAAAVEGVLGLFFPANELRYLHRGTCP